MKAEVENQPHCISRIAIEVPADRVTAERESISKDFVNHANLPGFRPGKAPRKVVERKYKKDIQEELNKKILSEATREAIKEKDLKILQISNVEDVNFADDSTLTFTAIVIRQPEFEVPDFKGIAVQVQPATVGDAEIDGMIERLREQAADFKDVEGRAVAMEDYAVIDYKGTIDGQPIEEVAPNAGKSLGNKEGFWLRMVDDAFLPGFCDQVVGLNVDESKEFDLTLADDFPLDELSGKTLHFAVTLKGIKEQELPQINDEFAAKVMPDNTLEQLRERIVEELTGQKANTIERSKKDQVMKNLLGQIDFELPEAMLADETRRTLGEIVQDNQSRGIDDKELEDHKDEIIQTAETVARDRLKSTFILLKIADQEGITVEKEDMGARIQAMAQQYRTTPDKIVEELQKHNGFDQIREEVLVAKALDFVASSASVQEVEEVQAS